MPVTRKQQILFKLETSFGLDASPGAADASQIFDPSLSDEVSIEDRVPASASLSRDFTPVGRRQRSITFRTDFRGSGDTTLPVTEPDWAPKLAAAGYRAVALTRLNFSVAPTGPGFAVGEIVNLNSGVARGVVVGAFQGGTPVLSKTLTAAGYLVVATISGTWGAATIAGESSGTTGTVATEVDYPGLCYQPTSEVSVSVSANAWTGTKPAAAGEVVSVERSGAVVGALILLRDNSGTPGDWEDFDATLIYGEIADNDTLRSAGNGTTTVSGDAIALRTPSATIYHNLDGRLRKQFGSRGNFRLEGEVGNPLQFNWTFTGDPGVDLDSAPIVTSGLSAVRPPRFLGSIASFISGAQLYRLATKRLTVDNGGTLSPNLDANRPGGSTGTNITDRDPSIQVQVDRIHGAFDWEAKRDSGVIVPSAFLLGSTAGNICGVIAPYGQVTEVADADADGIAAVDVTIKPRRVLESGDDELFFVQL